jgi:hypothetical protein
MRLLNKVKFGCGLLGHLTVYSIMVIGRNPLNFTNLLSEYCFNSEVVRDPVLCFTTIRQLKPLVGRFWLPK